ncbi:MAG: hypothetical protein LBS27_11035 [Bifidobacteriaceae bacterium]|jgi:hypothetical protein|nr:hypothetical protein [Bifidobacteriaceae bacterium]
MEWLTGTSGALDRAREGGAKNWKHPLIGVVMMIPLAYAMPVATFAAATALAGGSANGGPPVAQTARWLIGLTIVLAMILVCGVIAYRLFGWPVWGAIAFAVAAPAVIDAVWWVVMSRALG